MHFSGLGPCAELEASPKMTMGEESNSKKQECVKPSFSGQPPDPRSLHTATVVGDKFFVFGGYGESGLLNDVYIMDTVVERWIKPKVLGTPPSPRCAHSAVLLEGGRILVYGGHSTTTVGDIWFLEVDTPFVKRQSEILKREVVAWSKGVTGDALRPVVICGPSGVGKGTLIGKLMKDFPEKFGFSVSHTTRKPREKEQDGVHYHFTSRPMMETQIKEGKFLESAEVHGNLYGTSLAAVEAVSDVGKTCILDIDVQGAQLVKKSPLNALFLFIKPPYPEEEELEKRLRGRGTETEEQIQKRLKNAKAELERGKDAKLFTYTLVNANLDETYDKLKALLGVAPSASQNGTAKPHVLEPEARSGHSALTLGSQVLIYGGVTATSNLTALNDVAILDVSKLSGGAPGTTRGLKWMPAQAKPNVVLNGVKHLPTLPLIYDHRIVPLGSSERLVAGGFDSNHAPVLNEA